MVRLSKKVYLCNGLCLALVNYHLVFCPKYKEMSQYSFSYNYDSLNDAFNAVNRKGKMQKRYLSHEYLDKAQEYREMRKELNEILRKKKGRAYRGGNESD